MMAISVIEPSNDPQPTKAVNGNSIHHHADNTIEVPVLIVGGGPTGLLQAHLLSELGGACRQFF